MLLAAKMDCFSERAILRERCEQVPDAAWRYLMLLAGEQNVQRPDAYTRTGGEARVPCKCEAG